MAYLERDGLKIAFSDLGDSTFAQDVVLSNTGIFPVMQAVPASAVLNTVDVADSQEILVVADPLRMRVGLHNHSNDSLYVSCADTVTETSFTQVVQAHAYMEMDYSGIVTAVRPAGSATTPVMMTSYLMGG